MVVIAVDEEHVHGRALERTGCEQPAEPTADDDDLGPSWRLQQISPR
jgi:hypothetical protein